MHTQFMSLKCKVNPRWILIITCLGCFVSQRIGTAATGNYVMGPTFLNFLREIGQEKFSNKTHTKKEFLVHDKTQK